MTNLISPYEYHNKLTPLPTSDDLFTCILVTTFLSLPHLFWPSFGAHIPLLHIPHILSLINPIVDWWRMTMTKGRPPQKHCLWTNSHPYIYIYKLGKGEFRGQEVSKYDFHMDSRVCIPAMFMQCLASSQHNYLFYILLATPCTSHHACDSLIVGIIM